MWTQLWDEHDDYANVFDAHADARLEAEVCWRATDRELTELEARTFRVFTRLWKLHHELDLYFPCACDPIDADWLSGTAFSVPINLVKGHAGECGK